MICQTFVNINLTSIEILIREMEMDKEIARGRKQGLFSTQVFFAESADMGMTFEPAEDTHNSNLLQL